MQSRRQSTVIRSNESGERTRFGFTAFRGWIREMALRRLLLSLAPTRVDAQTVG